MACTLHRTKPASGNSPRALELADSVHYSLTAPATAEYDERQRNVGGPSYREAKGGMLKLIKPTTVIANQPCHPERSRRACPERSRGDPYLVPAWLLANHNARELD